MTDDVDPNEVIQTYADFLEGNPNNPNDFNKLDLNRDFNYTRGEEAVIQERTANGIMQIDLNRDGVMTQQEIMTAVKAYDANNDGQSERVTRQNVSEVAQNLHRGLCRIADNPLVANEISERIGNLTVETTPGQGTQGCEKYR